MCMIKKVEFWKFRLDITLTISLAEAMHIPVITASPIDEFQQKSYLISVAYRMGLKLKKNLGKFITFDSR